ncbi:MAG: flagellar protein FliS [Phycisphaerales bacterium]|jgi:flagellar protein FliS
MADPNTANAYLQTKVMSASPEELRLMLIEGALKFAIQGRDGILNEEFEQAFLGFSQCRPILLELINTIRPDHDPELAHRVRSLYTYMFGEIAQAGHERDVERIDKVIALLEYEKETWVLLMEKLATERAAGRNSPSAVPSAAPAVEARASFSIQG